MKNVSKILSCLIVSLTVAFLFVTIAPLSPMGIENTNVAVAATKINVTKVNLPKGSTYKLQVTGTKAAVTWSTSKKSVATVKNGVVTGKKAGTAVITAKVGKKKYTCKVTVLGCKINSNNVVMTKGKSYTLKVTGASKKNKIKYKSSKTSVASVNSKTGKITAKKKGSTTITVTVGKTSFPVTVKVETPILNKTKLILKNRATYSLNVNSSRKVTWKSSNTDVAKVSNSGKVTAIKTGSIIITAKLNDMTFSCTVIVENKTVINCPSTIKVGLGETVTYKITVGDDCNYSVFKGYVDCSITPTQYYVGDTLTMKVTGNFVGQDTITFVCENGWKKVINVTVTGTSMNASSIAPTINNVRINSFKAYKGTGTVPILNVMGAITNNNTLPLSYLIINYSFYDANGKYLQTFCATIDDPVKGMTYSFNSMIDSSRGSYPKGAASVIIDSIDAV